MTVRVAMRVLSVSRASVYRMIRAGRLRAVVVPYGGRRVRASDVARIAGLPVEALT